MTEEGKKYFEKGLERAAKGEFEKALEAYEKAIELDPNSANAWNNKGNALAELDRYEEAHVKVWDYEEGSGKIRIYLWLVELDYVVILEREANRKQKYSISNNSFPGKWKINPQKFKRVVFKKGR